MKELAKVPNILHFSMEILVLLGNPLHLTVLWNLFFDISILLYGKMLKMAEISHFWADFGSLKKTFLALKFEPFNQIRWNFQFSKRKEFLKGGGIDDSMQRHFGWKKWQKHPTLFIWLCLYKCTGYLSLALKFTIKPESTQSQPQILFIFLHGCLPSFNIKSMYFATASLE